MRTQRLHCVDDDTRLLASLRPRKARQILVLAVSLLALTFVAAPVAAQQRASSTNTRTEVQDTPSAGSSTPIEFEISVIHSSGPARPGFTRSPRPPVFGRRHGPALRADFREQARASVSAF